VLRRGSGRWPASRHTPAHRRGACVSAYLYVTGRRARVWACRACIVRRRMVRRRIDACSAAASDESRTRWTDAEKRIWRDVLGETSLHLPGPSPRHARGAHLRSPPRPRSLVRRVAHGVCMVHAWPMAASSRHSPTYACIRLHPQRDIRTRSARGAHSGYWASTGASSSTWRRRRERERERKRERERERERDSSMRHRLIYVAPPEREREREREIVRCATGSSTWRRRTGPAGGTSWPYTSAACPSPQAPPHPRRMGR
jgi:hypothetical protein